VQPTVEIRDRNDLPVAGAVVLFAVRGRGATFANGVRQLSVTTNLGRATVSELTPIGRGTLEIQVSANYQGQAATATIHQTNFASAAEAAKAGRMPPQSGSTSTTTASAAGGVVGGLSRLALAGIVGGAAAGTGIAVAVARRGDRTGEAMPTVPPSSGMRARGELDLPCSSRYLARRQADLRLSARQWRWSFLTPRSRPLPAARRAVFSQRRAARS
jgi:hypothetical protein